MVSPGGRARAERGLAILGLLAAICLGAWWTAQAVVDGSPGDVLVRFVFATVGALYYFFLVAVSHRRLARSKVS